MRNYYSGSVRISGGHLVSLTQTAVLNGGARAAIQSQSGEWEVLSYQTAELLEDGTYRLTNLLRGQYGTETEALIGADVDARIVFLGSGLETEAMDPSYWGTTEIWQAGPQGKGPGAFPYREQSVQQTGSGARPFAPVHLKASLMGSYLDLSWIRRSRIGGDNWSAGDIPLGEASEHYQVRTFSSDGEVLSETEVADSAVTVPSDGVRRVEVGQLRPGTHRYAQSRLISQDL